jgi:hypothetical protein
MSLIKVNMEKYRVIAHQVRRIARAEEFKPYDEVIMKQIPGVDAQQAEGARQAIREKYAALQVQMDLAQTSEELKALLPQE